MLNGKPLWINLASGTDLKDGFVNMDIVARWPGTTRGCDIVWDARKDRIPFDDGTADKVYAGYLLLHLAPRYHDFVLSEIHRVLAPKGIAIFGEVDMRKVMTRWLSNPEDVRCAELIWGEQGTGTVASADFSEYEQYDKHCQGFTRESLERRLLRAGFANVQEMRIHHPDVWWELTLSCVVRDG